MQKNLNELKNQINKKKKIIKKFSKIEFTSGQREALRLLRNLEKQLASMEYEFNLLNKVRTH